MSRAEVLGLAAILLFATALRLMHIGQESFWLDEGASVGIARLPWTDFFHVLWHREGNMALYYLLLRGWMVFGATDAWVRGLSALFSVATVPFLYLLGKDIRSYRVGLAAALLFAASPFAIRYAQEARGYSLVALLLTIATWALVHAVKTGERRWWIIWTIAMGASLYVHLFVVFVLLAQVIYLWRAGFRVPQLRQRLVPLLLSWMPVVAFVVLKKAGQLHWVPKITVRSALDALSQLSGGGDLALIVLVLVALAAYLTWHRGQSNEIVLVWLWLLLPIATLMVVSVFRPLLVPRFLVLELPALVLVVALALAEMPGLAGIAVLAAAVFFGVRTEAVSWKNPVKDDFRSATAYVLEHTSPQDGIIFYQALGRHVFEFYAKGDIGMQVIMPAHGRRATYLDFEYDKPGGLGRKIASAPDTIWVVLNSNEENGKPDSYTQFLMAQLKLSKRTCSDTTFRGVVVLRCGR